MRNWVAVPLSELGMAIAHLGDRLYQSTPTTGVLYDDPVEQCEALSGYHTWAECPLNSLNKERR